MQDDDADYVSDGPVIVRTRLPDWPRLMPLPLASAYFGVCAATFRGLGIEPTRIGRRVLWDRTDLDSFADALSGRPAKKREPVSEAKRMERRFFERLKNEGRPQRG